MALTRRALKAMGIEEEKIDEIISMHSETVDGLKADVAKYKADAEALPGVQKELNDLKASGGDWEEKYNNVKKEFDDYKAEQAGKKELNDLKTSGGDWEEKYNNVKKEFDDYKAEQAWKEAKAAKETAYRELLKTAGVDEKRIETIMKVTNLDDIEMADGKIKDADTLADGIKTEWADFIPSDGGKSPVKVDTGVKIGGGSPVTKESIMKIKDASQRQKAIAENIALFREG